MVLLALALFAASSIAGEDTDLRFQRYSVNQGLSQSYVTALVQDSDGYLWIGTQDGLNRYDGYAFEVYRHDPDSRNSLSGNHITSLYEDRSGSLWVGTSSGLNRFDRYTGLIERYEADADDPDALSSHVVTAIFEDRRGGFWVCTINGLNRLDRESGQFQRFRYDSDNSSTLSNSTALSIFEDLGGTLWVGTENGLNRFDPETETFERYEVESGDRTANAIVDIFESPSEAGELWLASMHRGLGLFDTQTGQITYFDHMVEHAHSVYEDGDRNVWIGTYGQGLLRFDRESATFSRYQHDPEDTRSLSDNRILSFLEDRFGGLWVGTMSGLSRVNPEASSFTHVAHVPGVKNTLSDNMVWSIDEDSSGVLWVGTFSGGLNRLDRMTGEWKTYRADKSIAGGGISSNGPLAVYVDRQGTLWIGSPNGLNQYDEATGTFSNHHIGTKSGEPGYGMVFSLYEDTQGAFWVGTAGALLQFDRRKQEFQRYTYYDHVDVDTVDGSHAEYPSRVTSIVEDAAGALWIGTTQDGLYRLDPARQMLFHYQHSTVRPTSLSSNSIQTIYESPFEPGVIWIGTFSGGLNRLDVASGDFEHFTQQNSDLPTNTVLGILGDDSGRLWMSTHRGLIRFEPDLRRFKAFDVERGIQSREFNFGAHHRSARGELFFGGINGFNVFRPDAIVDNPEPPKVVLTDFKLFDTSVGPGKDSPLEDHIGRTSEIVLSHSENDISFEYVGIHFVAPERNTYAYKLENYDDDWRVVGSRRSAVYTSLDPGDYTFRVRSANSDGVWNEEGAWVAVTVRPPWWQTGWAFVRRRLVRRERARSALREARLTAEAAEARTRVLSLENERKTRELEEARELQLSMLPETLPEHRSVEIAADMKTATEVGGDYYDFMEGRDGSLTVLIGDATGHGANAGTMVTATKSLFNVLGDQEDILEVLRKSTRALKNMKLRRLYMAAAIAKYDNYRLELAGAGMPPALVHHAATGEIEEVPLKGMPLGSFVDYPYEKTEVHLAPGDTVALMTDGYSELFNENGEMMGYESPKKVFAESVRLSPEAIVERFVTSGSKWAQNGVRDDDMTFVVLRIK
jgi:ligand-binding sensor domain-containing protein/serine phosphatase RsbU (regulator of sigma subunit)